MIPLATTRVRGGRCGVEGRQAAGAGRAPARIGIYAFSEEELLREENACACDLLAQGDEGGTALCVRVSEHDEPLCFVC